MYTNLGTKHERERDLVYFGCFVPKMFSVDSYEQNNSNENKQFSERFNGDS